MWKGVLKFRLGKTSLFQASSKMWNAVFISARNSKNAPSTLISLRFTDPSQMNPVRVHMTAMASTEVRKGKNMAEKVIESPVDSVRLEREVLKLKERIPKLDLYQRFLLPGEDDSGKRKIQSDINIPREAKIPTEEKLFKLLKELFVLEEEIGELEAMEAEHLKTRGCGHEYERKKMELLTRVEPLYNKAKRYELSAQSSWESFLISVFLPRFEFLLKKRSFCDKVLELSRIRDTYPKISQNQGNLAEFWKSLSFPVEPEYFLDEDLLSEREDLVNELVPLLESVIPRVKKKDLPFRSLSPEPGKYFDVVELLSRFPGDLTRNMGDRVALNLDTFKGKHVLICCFHVPYLFTDMPSDIQTLINICDELYSTRDDFEMVMVARMNSLANYREVFDHFFSGFPGLCLAVPFEDNQRRDYICSVIGLNHHQDFFQFLHLNAEGQVLSTSNSYSVYKYYGAEGFPFTEDVLHKRDLELQDMIFEKKAWLDRVLRCSDSSPDFVYKFNPASSPREEVLISQFSNKFKNKHVGLYLCSGGEFLPDLLDMYKKCREEQLGFEVVVVYMPFTYPYDPKVFQEKIDNLLMEYDICDWWCLPFNNSVSTRFEYLTKSYDEGYSGFYTCDKLIMVGPKVDHLDVYGAYVIRDEGINAFPFTVDAAIKARMKKVQENTLESLFVDDEVSVFRGNNSSDSRNLGQLFHGKKKTILCIDRLLTPPFGGTDFGTLALVYNQTKAFEKEDFEMVFVAAKPRIDAEEEQIREIPCHEMPWYICPRNGTNSTKVEELMNLISKGCSGVLVGFGEDGRVCFCQTADEVTFDAKRKRDPVLQFSLDNTLYGSIEHVMGYDDLVDHQMLLFANPQYGRPRP